MTAALIQVAQTPMRSTELKTFLRTRRVAHLATVDPEQRPSVIPICFAYDGKAFYSALDEKPKQVPVGNLRRIRNIRTNPEVAIVVDVYDEDWSRLKYVLIRGRARILASGKEHRRAVQALRRKYAQYRRMRLENRPVIKIVPWRMRYWSAAQ